MKKLFILKEIKTMFKFGRKRITLAVIAQKSNGFLSILEKKDLGSDVSFWRLEGDGEFRVYEFEANEDEYEEVLTELDLADIKYRVRLTNVFNKDQYIELI
jgi:hypothetical protein